MSQYINGRFVLTEAERRALERARQERLRREAEQRRLEEARRAEQKKREELRKEITGIQKSSVISKDHFSEAFNYGRELSVRNLNGHDWDALMSELNKKKEKIEKLVNSIGSNNDSSKLLRIKKELTELTADFFAQKLQMEKYMALDYQKLMGVLDDNLKKAFSMNISFDIKQIEKSVIEDTALDEHISKENFKKLYALKNLELSNELLEKVDSAINVMSDIMCDAKTFSALVVTPLEKECNQYLEKQKEILERYNDYICEYKALCKETNTEEQAFTATEYSIELLSKEIEMLKELAEQAEINRYITDSIDEVMETLGYSVIGHRNVTKKSGKSFSSDIYNFDDGTAVNVTMSQMGDISMEIGGLDTVDRTPTDLEARNLCPSMEHFCDKYKDVERLLAEKGIVLAEKTRVLPPTKEYAQIFNLSDYETVETASRVTKKKQNVSNNKEMRIDNGPV